MVLVYCYWTEKNPLNSINRNGAPRASTFLYNSCQEESKPVISKTGVTLLSEEGTSQCYALPLHFSGVTVLNLTKKLRRTEKSYPKL